VTVGRLPTRPLGDRGPHITTLGLGTYAIGGGGWSSGWGKQDDRDSLATIRRTLEAGLNWIDTAAEYGLGHSEEVVGRALKELPEDERPYVFTKCGLVWDPAHPMAESRQILKPESIRRECEDSLRRLGVERIDLYQFHMPDETGTPIEESWSAMARLADEGLVRWCGVSNFTTDLLDRCEAVRHVDSLQPPLSLLERDSAADLIPWCREHGAGVITYSPLGSGVLTTSFGRERLARMAPDDWRRNDPAFSSPSIGRSSALRDALAPLAERHDVTIEAVALAWVLAHEGVTGTITGARSPGQIDAWIAGASLELTRQDLEEISAAIARTGAGSGPHE
jgi:aryl-alcohol dehydrogenase-like predicted oxidoreductase